MITWYGGGRPELAVGRVPQLGQVDKQVPGGQDPLAAQDVLGRPDVRPPRRREHHGAGVHQLLQHPRDLHEVGHERPVADDADGGQAVEPSQSRRRPRRMVMVVVVVMMVFPRTGGGNLDGEAVEPATLTLIPIPFLILIGVVEWEVVEVGRGAPAGTGNVKVYAVILILRSVLLLVIVCVVCFRLTLRFSGEIRRDCRVGAEYKIRKSKILLPAIMLP